MPDETTTTTKRDGTHVPVPGERDRDTLTHREPGAIGSSNGEHIPPMTEDWLDDAARDEMRRDGGPRD